MLMGARVRICTLKVVHIFNVGVENDGGKHLPSPSVDGQLFLLFAFETNYCLMFNSFQVA